MLNKDFKEFIKYLNENKVKYLIVGGYAVALHGYPRYTKDMGVWIEMSNENAANMIKALNQFGFDSSGLKKSDFLEPNQFIQLGYPPNRIDIINSLSGVDFESCYSSKVVTMVDDIEVNFIDLENLKKNKKASGRFQDLADVENLE